jgi:hypothetical protein
MIKVINIIYHNCWSGFIDIEFFENFFIVNYCKIFIIAVFVEV